MCVPAHVHASVLVHEHMRRRVFEFAQHMLMNCACACLSSEFLQIKEKCYTNPRVVLEMDYNVKNIGNSFSYGRNESK